MSDTHCEVLKKGIIAHILEQMSVESSPLYDVRYALYKKDKVADPKDDEPNPKKQKKEDPPKKKEKKEEPKSKKKKKAKESSSGTSASDSHSDQ